MLIPESQKPTIDLISLITEGSKVKRQVKGEDGQITEFLDMDPKRIYWKTHLVNHDTFGRFVFELTELERMAQECFKYMTHSRAISFAETIIGIIRSFEYSIDAKSSETILDKQNKQASLINIIQKNKQERVYTMKGESKRTLFDGLMGRQAERDDADEN